jgi:predicted protein tyrosine phosphatase
VLRSPTAAWILSNEPFGFNTRSCGTEDYALIPLTGELVVWADEIICFDSWHETKIKHALIDHTDKSDSWPLIHNLQVEDDFDFKSTELIEILLPKLKEIFL